MSAQLEVPLSAGVAGIVAPERAERQAQNREKGTMRKSWMDNEETLTNRET